MSEPPIHLVRGIVLPGKNFEGYYWCGISSLTVTDQPFRYVYEAFFATCTACLEARSRAANAVKPSVIVPPYPVNPHG